MFGTRFADMPHRELTDMKNTISTYTFKKIIWGSVVYLLAVSAVFAANEKNSVKAKFNLNRTSSVVAETLEKKLKVDLAQNNLSVKIEKLAQTDVSGSELKLSGEASCLLTDHKTSLPIQFEAKINLNNQAVNDIIYQFVETEFAPSGDEEILMKELMQKISRDYKTQEIVIAIDNFETASGTNSKMQYKGIGEVRIGAFHWTKINFDVILNSDKSAANVQYKVNR